MRQANREAVFAWLDACNRKPKAELLQQHALNHRLSMNQPMITSQARKNTLYFHQQQKNLSRKTEVYYERN